MAAARVWGRLGALVLIAACGRTPVPATADDVAGAELGRCSAPISRAACGDWETQVAACVGADVHDSFPELDTARSCYVPVSYDDGELPRAGELPAGCGYEAGAARAEIEASMRRYQAIAEGNATDLPLTLACDLPDDVRRTAAAQNAAALRGVIERAGDTYPYALVGTFGFGYPSMSDSALVPWRPDQGCLELDKREMDRLSLNRVRAGRAAAGYHARLAPVISVSGGAVHAPLTEAFMLMHLAVCTFGVPRDAVLLDPCADHTHTNVRHTGELIVQLGARTGYIITDSGIQADYLQETTAFDPIGGAIDARALRDWGYLLGSWRQASVGIDAGFWFTPYRFWGEPHDGLGGFSCVAP